MTIQSIDPMHLPEVASSIWPSEKRLSCTRLSASPAFVIGGNKGRRAIDGKETCDLVAGIALLCAAVVLLVLPELLDYDAFIPFLFALTAFVSGMFLLISGRGRR